MNIFRILLLAGLVLATSPAFGQSIKSSYDKDHHLSGLKTYDYKVEDGTKLTRWRPIR